MKTRMIIAAIAAVAVAGFVSGQTVGNAPTDGVALKGIVLWPHQGRSLRVRGRALQYLMPSRSCSSSPTAQYAT